MLLVVILFSVEGCSHSSTECREPTDLFLNSCSMKQNCSVLLPETQIVGCGAKYADLLTYEYQCLPVEPSDTTPAKIFTCGQEREIGSDTEHGFLQSRLYPQYLLGQSCVFQITPPTGYGVNFYFLDVALSSAE